MDWFLPEKFEKLTNLGKGATLCVLGSGPTGVETALYGAVLGFKVRILEKAKACENLVRWGHVRCYTPWQENTTLLGRELLKRLRLEQANRPLETITTGRQLALDYLEPLLASPLLKGTLETGISVLRIGNQNTLSPAGSGSITQDYSKGFLLLTRLADGKEKLEATDFVADCTGTYGNPKWFGPEGLPAPGEIGCRSRIVYGLEDILGESKSYFAGKTTIVIGNGLMAAATVSRLALLARENPATWITWISHKPSALPIIRVPNDPYRERDLLAAEANTLASRGENHVEFFPGMPIQQVEWLGEDAGFRLHCMGPLGPKTFEGERLICHRGFMPDTVIWRELGVPIDPVREDFGAELAHPHRLFGFDVLGAKRYGRRPGYLMKQVANQVRSFFARITRQPQLDLYRLCASKGETAP